MGGKYKPYPNYKASGIEWLGDVPEGWDITGLSKLFYIKAGGDLKSEFYSSTQEKSHIYPIYTNTTNEGEVYGYTSHPYYKPNSITVTGRGYIGYAIYRDKPFDAIIRLLILYPSSDKVNPKFYTYFINGVIPFKVESSAIGQLSTNQIAPFQALIPSSLEQQQIVDFLDREVGKIEALIAKQERLVELLTEKRQAVISHAVTKGLNRKAPMKPSAIEWLGDIPEHWDVKPLKYVISYNDETLSEDTKGDFSFEYIDIGSVSSGKINKTDSIIFENAPSRARRVVRSGDIIISTVRTYLEAIAVIPDSDIVQIVSTGFCVIRSRLLLGVYSKYLFFTRFFITEVIARSVGVSYPAINASDLVNIYIPFPPSSEQQQIVDFLDQETKKIDSLIQKSQHMVILLKERKTALISAAVTGKIDVRN